MEKQLFILELRMNKSKIIIYFDYELQQGADMCSNKEKWGLDDFNYTNILLEFLKKENTKVCFATVGRIGLDNNLPYGSKSQIIKIHKLGHEIASHSMKHKQYSDMSLIEFKNDLIQSKKILEETIKTPVITYVPPRNLPFNLLGIGINLKKIKIFNKYYNVPILSKTKLNTIYSIIASSGYKIYRERDIIIKQNNIKNKKLIINKLDCSGFNKNTIDYIKKNKFKQEIITIYGHPHSLKKKGKQSLNEFKKLIKFLKDEDFKIILPRDLI